MRGRTPYGSPPPRRERRRSYSPKARREAPTSLLVRNISRDTRPDDLRGPFERYGPVKDVYLPKDYYTGEPRGFGFIQFMEPRDAIEAQYKMDHQFINGREVSVVFAEENRKKPSEMRLKESTRGRTEHRRSPVRGRSRSRSPRSRTRSPKYYSPSPKRRRYSRSYSPPPDKKGYGSKRFYPSPGSRDNYYGSGYRRDHHGAPHRGDMLHPFPPFGVPPGGLPPFGPGMVPMYPPYHHHHHHHRGGWDM